MILSIYSKKGKSLIVCNVYLGGGFKYGDSLMYMESFTHIIEHIRKTGGIDARIFSIEYGLAPEVNYFRSKEDCVNGYRYLVNDLQLNPKKIVFGSYSIFARKVIPFIF